MLFDDVIVPHVCLSCCQGLSSQDIHSESLVVLDVGVLHLDEGVLGVEAGVLGEGARDDEEGVGEALDAKLGFSRNFLGS